MIKQILLILIVLKHVNSDNAMHIDSNLKKSPNKISYEDLQQYSTIITTKTDTLNKMIIDMDELSTISPSSSLQSTQITFEDTFKALYNDNTVLVLNPNDIINLVKKGIVTENQAIMILESFMNKSNSNDNIESKSDDNNNNSISTLNYISNLILIDGKEFFGNLPILLILSVGYIIILLLYVFIAYGLYIKHSYVALLILSLIFIYNFSILATNLIQQLNYIFILSLIYNTIFLISVITGHITLCLIKLQNSVLNISEIFNPFINFKGKTILSIYSIFVGYIIAFQHNYILNQLPFYLSLMYIIWIISKKYYKSLPAILQPSGIFMLSLFGYILLIYLQIYGCYSFLPSNYIKYIFNYIFGIDIFSNKIVDFRFLGYFIATILGLILSPIYILCQYQNFGSKYIIDDMKYDELVQKVIAYTDKNRFSIESSPRSYWLILYTIIAIIYICLGYYAKHSLMALIAIFSMQSATSIFSKEKGIVNLILFYISGFLCINMTYLVGKMQDEYAHQIFGESNSGLIIGIFESLFRALLNYYGLEICVGYNFTRGVPEGEENENSKENEGTRLLDILIYFIKFAINYLLAVYLIVLAEGEDSYINSWLYSFSAILFFTSKLFFSALTSDTINRLFIAITIFLAGIRITLISPRLVSPFYFGSILIHLSVFASYISFNNALSLPIFGFMLFIIMTQATIMKSSFLMFVSIVNLCGFIATKLKKQLPDIIKMFCLILIINLCIIILSGFSMQYYYRIIQIFMQNILPKKIEDMLYLLFEERLLPEVIFVKYIINIFLNI